MLFKRFSIVFLGNGLSNLLLLIFEFVLAAKGVGRYGLFSICYSIILIISNISLLGFDYGTTRNIALFQKNDNDSIIATQIQVSVFIVCITSLIATLSIILGSGYISKIIFHKIELGKYLFLTAIIIILEAENQIMSAIFRGLREFNSHIYVSGLIKNVVLILSVPLIILYPLSVNHLLIFMLSGSFISMLYGIYKLRVFLFNKIYIDSFIEITKMTMKFSYLLFVWNVFQKVAGQGQTLLAGAFLSKEDVGVLAIFFRIISLFTFMQSVINQSIFVEFSSLDQQSERTRLKKLYISNSEIILFISLIIAIPILINPELLLSIFGNEYVVYAAWLIPIVLSQLVNVGTGPIGQLLISQKLQKSIILVAVIGSLTQLSLSLIFIPIYGFPAAIISFSTTLLLMTVLRHVISNKRINVHFINFEFIYFMSSGIISALLISRFLTFAENSFIDLLIKSVIAVIVFICLLFLYSIIDDKFKERIISYKSVLTKNIF